MTAEDIVFYLSLLGEALKHNGVYGEIILTGGAVMTLIHEARDSTKDIDALFEPKSLIYTLAHAIAEEHGLASDWLNDGVKGFISLPVLSRPYAVFGNLSIATVTPEYLLAMKLMALRPNTSDFEDVAFLLELIGITEGHQATELLENFFPANNIPPRVTYFLEEYFSRKRASQSP